MKKLLVALLATSALVFAGCNQQKEMKEEAKAPAAASQTVLRVAFDADPVSLDPHEQLSGGMLQYSHLVFDPLVRWTQQMTFEPRLAEKWEQVNPTTMRFFLRKGVKFHSGNMLTAADVKWTIDRLKTSPDFKGLFEPFVGAEVVDEHTVDLISKKPYGLTLNMATYIFPMDSKFYTGTDENGQPKDRIDKTAPTFAKLNESGTGAFTVTKRDQGVVMEFTRFADYWDTNTGNVEKLVLTPIKTEATRVAALLSGEADVIAPVPPQDFKRIRGNESTKLVTLNGGRIITFQMNQERVEAFKNPKVRQAVVYAVNNTAIVDTIMKGFATPGGQQGPKGYQGYKEELAPRFDLEKAKQLMKEAGYENGFEISMMAPNNRYVNDEKIAQAVASMLAKINIKVNLKTLPKAQYWDEFDARAADMMMIGWHSDTEDSGNFSEYLTMTPDKETGYGQYNSGNYSNARVDELTIAAQSETDLEKRRAMLQEIEQILYDEAAFVPLHWQHLSWGAANNVELEKVVNSMNFPYFGDIIVK
jgi:peptide/nickel transport system substrate-binding protein